MKCIDNFLQEDMLIVRPTIYIYLDKEKYTDVTNKGILLDKDYISCYLKRLPNIPQYTEFLSKTDLISIAIFKLRKIENQKVKLIAANISGLDNNEIPLKKDHIITQLQRKYSSYIDVCYKDMIPLDKLPRIDLYLSKRFVPGFVCKVIKS